MLLTLIAPYIPYVLLSTFVKCIALLIIAALIQLFLTRLSSHMKHLFWLFILFIVVLMPLCSAIIPADIFPFTPRSGVAYRTLYFMDTVVPRYGELGTQVQYALGKISVSTMLGTHGTVIPWKLICLMVWLTGIVYFLARVIIGRFGIMRMRNGARVIESSNITRTLESVSGEFRIRRNVQVLVSSSCRVPFTYRTFKPVILLPSGTTSWPRERLRSVLIHELAHVKRVDSLTRLLARIVCSVFWFIPLVWIAYRHLYIEQEKSCDECAVEGGIEAARYARHILNVVRFARGGVLLTGIYFLRGKRKMLEKRILNLFRFKRLGIVSKKRMFIITIILSALLIVPVLVSNPLSADDREYVMQDNEEICGMWINPDYDETWKDGKFIYEQDGVFRAYDVAPSEREAWIAKYTITDRWVDAEGNIWYKWLMTEGRRGSLTLYDYFFLSKISDSGRVQELSLSGHDYPTEIRQDSLKYEYRIYYRQ